MFEVFFMNSKLNKHEKKLLPRTSIIYYFKCCKL